MQTLSRYSEIAIPHSAARLSSTAIAAFQAPGLLSRFPFCRRPAHPHEVKNGKQVQHLLARWQCASARLLCRDPSDDADLPEAIRAVTIGTAGTLAWRGTDGASYVTATLPPGTYALGADRILATGTTAADITGWV